MRLGVHQSFAFGYLNCRNHTLFIANVPFGPVEIKLIASSQPQRGHIGPLGHRFDSRKSRALSSLEKRGNNVARFKSASMPAGGFFLGMTVSSLSAYIIPPLWLGFVKYITPKTLYPDPPPCSTAKNISNRRIYTTPCANGCCKPWPLRSCWWPFARKCFPPRCCPTPWNSWRTN
jgi:hypothetical protein